ncbi:hypothetical protein FA13DRAFT_1820524 [Coprinellus micaceus]|uniref:F-box domain-containing protein n=1 Tax=Coprinellus micaceus TaxID=71717 RepID=A0A4Y7SEK3_COPMI|nr:hypothetical protein FA13DRAFT_1820524 [Coprinellus micaceus]
MKRLVKIAPNLRIIEMRSKDESWRNYRSIGNFTTVPTPTEIEEAKANAPPDSGDTEKEVDLLADEPVLKRVYLERPDTLRALSQTCVAYRGVFLPLLFERLEVCVTTRPGNPTKAFYRHISETMQRKCSGLAERPDLSEMVAKAHVSFTKQNADKVLPTFLRCLENLPNLHTIKVVFAPLSMTTTIKNTFEKVSLPTIRTVVVPAYCHEILRACPEVRSVWCMEEDGGKLVAALGKGKCGKVEELRGCSLTPHMMKRLVKIAPNLRIIEINEGEPDDNLATLKSFKQLHTIDVARSDATRKSGATLDPTAPEVAKTIESARAILKTSPSREKKYLRLCWKHEKDWLAADRAYVCVTILVSPAKDR